MAERTPTQHKLLEREKHIAVAIDGVPREARYLTTYDDGTTAETIHVLYMVGEEVQSQPVETWQPAMADAPRQPTLAADAAGLRARVVAELERMDMPVAVYADAVLAELAATR